eukprot:1619276-Amphidinium_carterae.1
MAGRTGLLGGCPPPPCCFRLPHICFAYPEGEGLVKRVGVCATLSLVRLPCSVFVSRQEPSRKLFEQAPLTRVECLTCRLSVCVAAAIRSRSTRSCPPPSLSNSLAFRVGQCRWLTVRHGWMAEPGHCFLRQRR